ncbi:MAG: DUF3040 domain-containing protein [Actinomycetia bacterium]|nr:DUF3040 domain-containing protein [Actinomycetes bacterium]
MPLSEDEQRILQEIEEQLTVSDPALAKNVGSTTLYTHAFRSMRLAVLGFGFGLVGMFFALSVNVLLAFAGFLVMLGSALWFERNARKLGRAGMQQVTQNLRGGNVRDAFGSTRDRMKDRFRREEED